MTAEQIRGQQLRQRQTVKMNDRACHANPHDVTHPPLLSSSWKLGPSKSRLIRDTSIPPREFKLRALGRATKVGTTNGKLGSFAAIPVIVSVKRSRFGLTHVGQRWNWIYSVFLVYYRGRGVIEPRIISEIFYDLTERSLIFHAWVWMRVYWSLLGRRGDTTADKSSFRRVAIRWPREKSNRRPTRRIDRSRLFFEESRYTRRIASESGNLFYEFCSTDTVLS